MIEVERIIDQLTRAFEGQTWHGPSVLEIIEGVTSQQAAEHPIAGAHSTWELVLHIRAWEHAIVRRLSGDRAQLPTEENWPPVTATDEEDWDRTKLMLKQGHHELRSAIAVLDDSRLDQPIIEGMSSIYVQLHGVIQHDLYHAGQIALLKKQFRRGNNE
jgi:uncharacterized damage-inducible protein DinB